MNPSDALVTITWGSFVDHCREKDNQAGHNIFIELRRQRLLELGEDEVGEISEQSSRKK